jgi:hypothetical protein
MIWEVELSGIESLIVAFNLFGAVAGSERHPEGT